MSELSRIAREHSFSEEEREERVRSIHRIAAEDLVIVDRLAMAWNEAKSGAAGKISGQRIKQTVIRAVIAADLMGVRLPHGLTVGGTGDKTPYYLYVGHSGNKLDDADMVEYALSGKLYDLAEFLDERLTKYKRDHGLLPPAEPMALPGPDGEEGTHDA